MGKIGWKNGGVKLGRALRQFHRLFMWLDRTWIRISKQTSACLTQLMGFPHFVKIKIKNVNISLQNSSVVFHYYKCSDRNIC